MGPEFSMQRAVWQSGVMVQDPETSQGGDYLDYAPNDPRRVNTDHSGCVLGRPGCGEFEDAEGANG